MEFEILASVAMTAQSSPAKRDKGLAAIDEALAVREAMGLHPRNKVELASALDISKQALSTWAKVPPARALAIEQLLGVPRTILRPDIFGPHKGRYRYSVRVDQDRAHGGRRT